MREEQELKGLDPNSEEALKKCKYLRRRERTKDSWEDMTPGRKSTRRKDKQTSRSSKDGKKSQDKRAAKK